MVKTPLKKGGQRSEEKLSQEDIQMVNKHIKRSPKALAIREIQLKATMTNDCTPFRLTKIKSIANAWAGQDVKHCIPCIFLGGM